MKYHIVSYLTLSLLTAIIIGCNNQKDGSATVSAQATPGPSSASAGSGTPADSLATVQTLPALVHTRLVGKWLRSDGTYTIEVFTVREDGFMDAGYFNPNPIHVEKSEWKSVDNKLYIRVILKDVNYPGSTYTLIYFPEKDQLEGNYFQAVEGYNYDVTFQRSRDK